MKKILVLASLVLLSASAFVACDDHDHDTVAPECEPFHELCEPFEGASGVRGECAELAHMGPAAQCTARAAECIAACSDGDMAVSVDLSKKD